jgi:protein N-terminal methyltransferase
VLGTTHTIPWVFVIVIILPCVADTGAGVGRVTKQLLLHFFGTVDVLEPSAHLLAKARASLPPVATVPGIPPGHTAGRFFQQGLESFEPEPGRYDCIWVQWCLLYLTDDDLIACLRRAATGLKGGGRIVVKENICKKGFVVDRSDSSLTRSTAYLSGLFARADMATIYSAKQRGMPEELFEVRMFVLQPRCASVSAPALLGSGSKRKATEDMQEQDASSPGQA